MNDLCTWLIAISTTAIQAICVKFLLENDCRFAILLCWFLNYTNDQIQRSQNSGPVVLYLTHDFLKLISYGWLAGDQKAEFWTICILLWQQTPPCNIQTKRKLLNKNLSMPYSRRKSQRWNLMGKEVVTIALLVAMLLVVLMLVL